MKLLAYDHSIGKDGLKKVILKSEVPATVEIGYERDLENVIDLANNLVTSPDLKKSEKEAQVAPQLHQCLESLPQRQLTDPHLWHWMATTVFKEFVIHRWKPNDADLETWLESTSGRGRFLGSNTNMGFRNNAIARLFWTAEFTYENGSYDLTTKALLDTDLHQNLFARNAGLEPRLARICIAKMSEIEGFNDRAKKLGLKRIDLHREALKIIRVQMQTTVLEAYNNEMLQRFVDECMDLAIDVVLGNE